MRKIYFSLLLITSFAAEGQCIYSGTPFSSTTIANNISCTINDGGIIVKALNGYRNLSAPNGNGYSYAITSGPVIRPSQSSNLFPSLPIGNYIVSITDCNGTTISQSVTIAGTVATAITYNPIIFRSICNNNNGVKINANGGKPPYAIVVLNTPAGSTPVISGDTIRGLTPGQLDATITDACGTTLGISTTIATNFPIPTSNNIASSLFYGGCNGIAGDQYHPSYNAAYLNYSLSIPASLSFEVDTFMTELYFNGSLMQTIIPSTINEFNFNQVGMHFTGYGQGVYLFRSYSKCSGLIKTDSVTIGNRPSSPVGTNTNLGGINVFGLVKNYRCADFDFQYRISFNGWINTIKPLGSIMDVLSPNFKLKIISGPSHLSDSTYSVYANNSFNAQINNLSYSATPYVFEISDTCGIRDTFYLTQNIPTYTPKPTATIVCEAFSLSPNYINANILGGASSLPKVYPFKTTVLSGTPLGYTTYPITIVDSVGLLTQNTRRLPIPYPGTNFKIAYENACGQKDTTVWTFSSCPPNYAGTVTSSVVANCGNKGNITLTNALSDSKISVGNASGPNGTNLFPTILSNTATSVTYFNVLSGTYTFRGAMGNSAPTGGNTALNTQPYYLYLLTANQTSINGYPITTTDLANYRASITYSNPIDTSKLRIWDTTFTVVVPNTALSVTASEAYLCKDASSSNVMAHSIGTNPPFSYSYSTVSSTGPFTTSGNDSLIVIPSISANSPVWIKVTDACSSNSITNTTIQSLTSAKLLSCSNGNLTITPNPDNSSFIHQLESVNTRVTNTYHYGTPVTIDLNDPSNAGNYFLKYKLASASSIGCTLDSVQLLSTSPCQTTLPIRLLQFIVQEFHESIKLDWVVATETENNLYEIEKSEDAVRWKKIASVAQLSSLEKNTYSYLDISAEKKDILYYRIKLIENNGIYKYSSVIQIRKDRSTNNVIIYPNPVNNNIDISLENQVIKSSYLITDMAGKIVSKGELLSQMINKVNTMNLSAGFYLLKISLPNNKTFTQKINVLHK